MGNLPCGTTVNNTPAWFPCGVVPLLPRPQVGFPVGALTTKTRPHGATSPVASLSTTLQHGSPVVSDGKGRGDWSRGEGDEEEG